MPLSRFAARAARATRRSIVASALVGTALVATTVPAAAASLPSTAIPAAARATVLARDGVTTCDRVVLRTGPSGLAERVTSLDAGVDVTIVATVTSFSWRTTCEGGVVSGRTWFKIGSVAGQSVASRYGVDYVYAPTGQFSTESIAVTPCLPALLNAGPSSLTPHIGRVQLGAIATVTATVIGQAWHVRCDGRWLAGTAWYRISALDGRSLSTTHSAAVAYVPTGLMVAAPDPSDPSTLVPTSGPLQPLSPTAPNRPGMPPLPTAGIAQGIDVSHHNGLIDWQKVRTQGGKKFVYIKASEATEFIDWTYARNRAGAKAAGLIVGAYHFARPGKGRGDAIAEADHFMGTAQFGSGELVPILDLEHTGGLSRKALGNWTLAFLNRVYERSGIRPAIYVSPTFWAKHVGNTTRIAQAGYNILWIAHWTHDGAPKVPAANWAGEGWTFWQFSNKGKVPGIKGRVDFDRMAAADLARVIIP